MIISSKAKELYKKVIQAYKDNPGMLMSEILNKYLKDFNDEIAEELNKEIIALMSGVSAGKIAIEYIPYTKAKLSSALYKNAKDAAKTTYKVMQEHIKTQSTIQEIKTVLYDGYGYEELLDIKKTLPKYLWKDLAEAKVNRLKTNSLRNAYIRLLEAKTEKAFEKAMWVALEEKARYYAQRIATTENAKAFTLSNAQRQMDMGVEYVKWTMSSLHKTACVCEFYAYQDIGYGVGVYKLMSAPAPVYSTHPHCRCSLRPVYRTPKYKKVPKETYPNIDRFPDVKIKDLFKT